MKMTCRAVAVGVSTALALVLCSCADETMTPTAPRISTIGGMPGPEDLAVDCTLGYPRLLVSSVDRTDQTVDGHIFVVDVRQEPPVVTPLKIEWKDPPRFRPQGMAIVKNRLFVINRGDESDRAVRSIEGFEIKDMRLIYKGRITGTGLTNPNDLDVRVLPDGVNYELFVSNPVKITDYHRSLWEILIGPRYSFVARLRTDMRASTRIDGFRYCNGVAVTSDGRLYVAARGDEAVFSCPIDPAAGAPRQRIEIDGLVDNLTVEDSGTILVTAGRSSRTFARHAAAATERASDVPLSPTTVWRIHPGDPPKTTLLFEDSGWRVSGGSSAVCIDDDLYIGQVFGDYVTRVEGVCARGRP